MINNSCYTTLMLLKSLRLRTDLVELIEVMIHGPCELTEILNLIIHSRVRIRVDEITEEKITHVIILNSDVTII